MLHDRIPSGPANGDAVIAPGETPNGIGMAIGWIVLERPGGWYWYGALAASCLLIIAAFAVQGAWNAHAFTDPAGATAAVQAMDIACYDLWIGIACGSLLVSAMLRLAEVEWRCAVTRIAETVAVLAAGAALALSILRPGWLWVVEIGLSAHWPVTIPADPRAILVSDAMGLALFLVIALAVWAAGLLPDLAILRDMARARDLAGKSAEGRSSKARLYGWLAMDWQGSARQWQVWTALARTMALLAMILCAALQTAAAVRVAAMMPQIGAGSLLPVTLLVGAVLSGTGLTAAVVVAIRESCGLKALITERHLDILARMLLVFGLVSLYGHVTEWSATLLNGDAAARTGLVTRFAGEAAVPFWTHVVCALLSVQLFWLRQIRRSGFAIGCIGILTVIGTLADRTSLVLAQQASMDPAIRAASVLQGVAGFLGALGIFLALLVLSLRVIPILSITELRWLALLHNPGAASAPLRSQNVVPARFARVVPSAAGFLQASFASDRALAAAIRIATERGSPARFAAFGPVPMPESSAMLRLPEPAIADAALAGALIGGIGFFALCQWDIALGPSQSTARAVLAWPFLVLPSVSFAAMTGVLAALLAFAFEGFKRTERSLGAPIRSAQVSGDRFVLAAEWPEGEGDSDWIERKLSAIAEPALRPLSVSVQQRSPLPESRP